MAKTTTSTRTVTEVTVRVPKMLEVSEFKQLRYPGRRPCINTLKKWITRGDIQGEVRGGIYFVNIAEELMNTGDALLNKILEV
ncbi:hypothetical protein [Endozoicomonas ascidiicola]|uniref:hypothetical protein n=1 Tax=Endozoicomonas ascidiicola TaxID=1698521 RepID=UPI00082E1977|nr:hypothetical protein [Endozoicomonas ascidiicola]